VPTISTASPTSWPEGEFRAWTPDAKDAPDDPPVARPA
jgi:hypothetical protein